MKSLILILLFFGVHYAISPKKAEILPDYSSQIIQNEIKKLRVLGSVLYIAAHPDDENQRVLSYFSKGKHFRTAYLSLTRGDGGQNLLGPEKGTALGLIRTHELYAARSIDGAEQFFTDAIDFGYSKTADESLKKWNRQRLLEQLVWVIRSFKPDVIITRFSDTQGGHGHHLSSAILAEEALIAAASATKFPKQLKSTSIWQAKRLYWNSWLNSSRLPMLTINTGQYNALLGKSYNEIAALSRSMHKSQGFGATPKRSTHLEKFTYLAGDTAQSSLFEDIDTSWGRVKNGQDIQTLIAKIEQEFNPAQPHKSVNKLIELYSLLQKKGDGFWFAEKKKDVKNLIRLCSGLWLESLSSTASATPGENVTVRHKIINRTPVNVKIESIHLSGSSIIKIDKAINENSAFNHNTPVTIAKNASFTQPPWLMGTSGATMYAPAQQNKSTLITTFSVIIAGAPFTFKIPVRYRFTDPQHGESYSAFTVRPAVSLGFNSQTYVFREEKIVSATIKAEKDSVAGNVILHAPQGWLVTPQKIAFNLTQKGAEQLLHFSIKPGKDVSTGSLKLIAQLGNQFYDKQLINIHYPHVGKLQFLKPAMAKAVKPNLIIPKLNIAYIMGSGDEIPNTLKQLGINVTLLSDQQISNLDLNQFDAIVCGVRAFNTRAELGWQQQRLITYVENGGTWIVQHNTRFGIQPKQMGPFPIVARGRHRLSQEDAPIRMLDSSHPIFNFPNKIAPADFDGWVHERGTYLAESWEGKLFPLLAGHDSGEPDRLGSLLYAKHGKGVYIYTAISWFRQLPAGIPGATKIFVNLLSATHNKE